MSKKSNFNLDFRPVYFGPEDLEKHFGARVKGELRRQAAMDMAASGDFDEEVMSSGLDDEHRKAVSAIHPWLMGGEYLPDLLEGEIEIARVTLASTTMDVISIRAQIVETGFNYRIVDEYEGELDREFEFEPKTTVSPLSMKEIIGVIDGSELVTGPRDMNLEGGATIEDVYNFATVTSVFYPELEAYYTNANEAWLEDRIREEAEEEERDEREAILAAARRKKILAPYRTRIDQYVLCFGDRTIPNPRWRGHRMLQDVAKRFVEEYLVAHGELPTGKHQLSLDGHSGPEHDFSDL
jgi:hypothetical protein